MRKYALALLVMAACSHGPATPTGHALHGKLTAPSCGGGYQLTNAAVTLKDESGTVIGTATTSATDEDSYGPSGCNVEFTMTNVPDAKFYSLTVGTHGGPDYSLAQMESANWTVDLTL